MLLFSFFALCCVSFVRLPSCLALPNKLIFKSFVNCGVHVFQKSWCALSSDLLHQASDDFTEMLHVAQKCFTMAATVTSAEEMEPGGYSEDWLLNYMLGKIAEKLNRPPHEYLDHYHKVQQLCSYKILPQFFGCCEIQTFVILYIIQCCIFQFIVNKVGDGSCLNFALMLAYSFTFCIFILSVMFISWSVFFIA